MGREQGISKEQMGELAQYRESAFFTAPEKLVIEYAEQMTLTPVGVRDELFSQLRAHFDDAQLVELTAVIAWENFRARFNHALGIEAQGFSEGAFCALPERPSGGHPSPVVRTASDHKPNSQ